jgi:hypothetical protein
VEKEWVEYPVFHIDFNVEGYCVYVPGKNIRGEFYAANFVHDLWTNNMEGFMTRIKAFFAGIPYDLGNKGGKHSRTLEE